MFVYKLDHFFLDKIKNHIINQSVSLPINQSSIMMKWTRFESTRNRKNDNPLNEWTNDWTHLQMN